MNRVEETILEVLKGSISHKEAKILVACSGGKDSVVLAHGLHAVLLPEWDMAIGHVNHGLREEASEDESFVEHLARRLQIPFFSARCDVRKEKGNRSLEEAARIARYRELEGIMARQGYHYLVTAHTRNDQAETLLYRIFTGTGLGGLTSIREKRGSIIRPILRLDTGDILAYIEDKKLSWQKDRTNDDVRYMRNAIRHTILPVAEEVFPRAKSSLEHLASLAGEYGDYIARCFHGELERNILHEEGRYIVKYSSLDHFLFMEFLRYISHHYFDVILTYSVVEEIGKKLTAPKSNLILYQREGVVLLKTLSQGEAVVEIVREVPSLSPWYYSFSPNELEKGVAIGELNGRIVPDDAFRHPLVIPDDTGEIVLRSREAGDVITLPFGRKKVKDILIDHHCAMWDKNRVIIVEIHGKVVMVNMESSGIPAVYIDEEYRVRRGEAADEGKKILAMVYEKKIM